MVDPRSSWRTEDVAEQWGEYWRPEVIQQWSLIRHGLDRLEAIYAGLEGAGYENEYEAHAFFLMCHHLADFLIQFQGVPKAMVHGFVAGDPSLALCRDLVINLKHARMASTPLSPGGAEAALGHTLVVTVRPKPEGPPVVEGQHWSLHIAGTGAGSTRSI